MNISNANSRVAETYLAAKRVVRQMSTVAFLASLLQNYDERKKVLCHEYNSHSVAHKQGQKSRRQESFFL